MRVVLAGGGTGGHITPALAIAEALRVACGPRIDIHYVGSPSGLEAELVPRAGFRFYPVAAGPLMKPGWQAKLRGVWRSAVGFRQARQVLRAIAPQVVVGTGGYVAGPVGLAAVSLGIPLVLQEQNVWPGLTNRWLARRAAAVLVPYAEAAKHFPAGAPLHVVGNPVRPSLLAVDRAAARQALGIVPHHVLVVATGGSQGAPAVNRLMARLWELAAGEPAWAILWATGPRHFPSVAARLGDPDPDGRRRAVPYLYDMDTALAAADLLVGRAGAMTCAEAAARGVPAVLIPSPYVAENHQAYNARYLESEGAAIVVEEAAAETEGVVAVAACLRDPEARARMSEAARRLHRPDAMQQIVDIILRVARRVS